MSFLYRFICITLFVTLTIKPKAQCFTDNIAFASGEEIKYHVAYNWGFIWLNAGTVEFKVKDAYYNNKPMYHLYSYGTTYKNYDWFFKVRDTYQSYLDKESLMPAWFDRKNYEGGYTVHNTYEFDYKAKKIYAETENSDKPFTCDTLKMPACTFDLISLIYYTRNLDFSNAKIGQKYPVRTIIDNEIFDLYMRYLGKETIELPQNRGTYRCDKFSALLVEGTIFKGGEDMFVWVTNDRNRIPVLVEAKILIGSVKAILISSKGLKNTSNAKLSP